MDPIFRFPASPGTPLFPVSPERANRQQLPQSPSLPSISNIQNDILHSRGNSDVQGKVAQFNSLSREAAQRRKDGEDALKRAVLGREEAESETRRLKEENRLLRRDVEEGRARERRVGERVEGVMEELQRSKETQAHAQTVYEKEVRRARKEAFKASSALVKLQEELKSTRNKSTLMREEVDVQRRKVDTKDQEILATHDRLVELQEELEKQKQQNKIFEEEQDRLKTSLKEEHVARTAVETAIAQPLNTDAENIDSTDRRRRRSESMKENVDPEAPRLQYQLKMAREQLRMEKRMRLRADDQVHFMKMECQFQCCSCRMAERQGVEYVHDNTWAAQVADTTSTVTEKHKNSYAEQVTESLPGHEDQPVPSSTKEEQPSTPRLPSLQREKTDQDLLTFSPKTGTFSKVQSPTSPTKPSSPLPLQETPERSTRNSQSTPRATDLPSLHSTPFQPTLSSTFPHTPRPLPIPPPRTISYTKTITVPLKDDMPFSPAPATPGGVSREEALEQIRQRRGRARSIAAGSGTPRKRMVEDLRRDISAPGRV
ncbi:hypothetical protein BDR22DRAFT_973625 [Usnea florida]